MDEIHVHIEEKKLMEKLTELLFQEHLITYAEKAEADRLIRESDRL